MEDYLLKIWYTLKFEEWVPVSTDIHVKQPNKRLSGGPGGTEEWRLHASIEENS